MSLVTRLVLAFLILTALSFATPAHAGWSPDGATIVSTTSYLGPIAACNDGGFGTFVVWQEAATPGAAGPLKALHVLPTGDVDPSWPAGGAVVSTASVARSMVGALPDHLGGFYVWWKQGQILFATRMLDHAVAAGWPSAGRSIATVDANSPGPSVIEDGSHGFYAAWAAQVFSGVDPVQVSAIHLGPNNTGAGGWTNAPRSLVSSTEFSTVEQWPQLALAPDGGVFLAWASHSADPGTQPSAFWLERFTSAGVRSAGWPAAGLNVGAFDADLYAAPYFKSALLALSPDGRGGVFVLEANPTSYDGYWSITADLKLLRRQGDGATAIDWPDAGRLVPAGGGGAVVDGGTDGSLRVFADGRDGAIAGAQANYSEFTYTLDFKPCSASGTWGPWSAGGSVPGYEAFASGDGGMFVASFSPDGPNNQWDSNAYISVGEEPHGQAYSEYHYDPVVLWYGDIALASSGDGGSVFYWSQVRDRYGLFARRLTPGAEVTGVTPSTPAAGLRELSFASGQGVRARVDAVAGARLELFDVAGRRLASARFDQEGPAEIVLPGTAALSPGLYFAHFAGPRVSQTRRVSVTR